MVILTILFFVLDTYYLRIMNMVGLYALTMIGYIIFMGYTGQVLLCQASLMAIGAYTTALLTTPVRTVVIGANVVEMPGPGLPPIVGIMAGVALAVVFAYLLGKVILRLRLWYLAIATLAIGVITDSVLVGWIQVTGGDTGIRGIPPFSLGGLVFETNESFYIIAWIVALAGWVFALHLGTSRVGRAFSAINRDEIVAGTLGVNVARYKVQSFMLCAAYAALSGGLLAHYVKIVTPNAFNLLVSFEILMAAILGGFGTIYAVFLAAPLLKFLPEMVVSVGDYKLIIYGILFIVVPMYFAGGISGLMVALWRRLPKFITDRRKHVY